MHAPTAAIDQNIHKKLNHDNGETAILELIKTAIGDHCRQNQGHRIEALIKRERKIYSDHSSNEQELAELLEILFLDWCPHPQMPTEAAAGAH